MAAITSLPKKVIETILQQYDAGQLASFTPTPEGIENTNYFVRTHRTINQEAVASEFVLSIIESHRPEQLPYMIRLLDQCAHYGLPVASVIKTTSGEAVYQIQEKPVLLSARIKGQHVLAPVRDQCEAIGRFLARMHLVTQAMNIDEVPYLRDANWLESTAQSLDGTLDSEFKDLLRSSTRTVVSALERPDVQALPQGGIHGDLFRDNALFNKYGLTGILDFHHAGYGFFSFDLAVAVNDWCRSSNLLDPNRTFALLRAYHSIRPLEPQEFWFFPVFLLYAALAFWLSRLDAEEKQKTSMDVLKKDPREFAQLVKSHTIRPFRIAELALRG